MEKISVSTELISVGNDAKTIKGQSDRYLTGVLYIAPNVIGTPGNIATVCPNASPGCIKACLYTGGRGAFSNVQIARINRTQLFFENRFEFMNMIARDIAKIIRKADEIGYTPAIRLNGTSDIPWEKVKFLEFENIMQAFPGVQFYDYTKSYKRALEQPYDITFSRSETNEIEALALLRAGINVSVVFNIGKNSQLPESWNGFQVIDGDLNDLRFNDPKPKTPGAPGYVVGLRLKRTISKDNNSGFAVDVEPAIRYYLPAIVSRL